MTPWQPIYLRADDEAAMMQALDAAGLVGADPETGDQVVLRDERRYSIVVRGVLYELIDVTADESLEPVYESVPVDGYHVDLLTADAALVEALAPVIIEPTTPRCGWFGIDRQAIGV